MQLAAEHEAEKRQPLDRYSDDCNAATAVLIADDCFGIAECGLVRAQKVADDRGRV